MKIGDMPNIGPHNEAILAEVGVTDSAQLIEMGAEQAWLRMKAVDPGICLHALYGLEGAIQGIPKKDIDPARKAALKQFFNAES